MDKIPGGLADHKKPSDFSKKELKEGIKDEASEHTKSKAVAREIAMDHLTKDPHYYSHQKKMEKVAKELTAKGRARVAGKNFVFPEQKRYPIHDEQHARSALGFSKMHGTASEQAAVRAAVSKKYPNLIEKKAMLSAFADELTRIYQH